MTAIDQEIACPAPPAASTLAIDLAIVLARTIADADKDPAQFRNVVYQLARVKIQQEAAQRDLPVSPLEMEHLTSALEIAIDRVETMSLKHDNPRVLQSGADDSDVNGRDIVIAQPRKTNALPTFLRRDPFVGISRRDARPSRWPQRGPLLRTAIVITLALTACVLLGRHFGVFGRFAPAPVALAVQNKTPTVVQASRQGLEPSPASLSSQSAGFPLPNAYGVYAVNDGQLHELEPLVGRVPDQRVFMSTPIRTASRTTLPDGRVAFIVYRRDVASSAPDRVAVRVIAKVMRAMTFDTTGQAKTTDVEDSWTIRNLSYEFRVAPLSEGSEMLVLRPENPDFLFPAGRYGLVIKGQAYDFTVAGPITEAAQCLENVKAANGAFYSECRQRNAKQL
jgi:hypothetical protein